MATIGGEGPTAARAAGEAGRRRSSQRKGASTAAVCQHLCVHVFCACVWTDQLETARAAMMRGAKTLIFLRAGPGAENRKNNQHNKYTQKTAIENEFYRRPLRIGNSSFCEAVWHRLLRSMPLQLFARRHQGGAESCANKPPSSGCVVRTEA